MAAIQQEILDDFLALLKSHDEFSEPIVDKLDELLSGPKKAKPVDVEKALSPEEQEDAL